MLEITLEEVSFAFADVELLRLQSWSMILGIRQ
jgi:hypothetical protein